ncbi:type 4a pilus biogenesis protein PilO [Aestuariirhabdus sp. Z084]|uniref:type 4a pilus biogenesis protein PilO n=1 Tax=Aestuariirhabdus haliotis TaxID=2918751 RepID=UPI00201B39C6|nr:type 4a pilus biogenesis protein PilO [Aestuariirhabdus haliotis]MCL6414953.1 type 4a pilus biogenesis protein PilO [Aestuariirhabdus haliotis]MCL6418885.1 type 4a pilus biogenesis protein PilO [Aestuariirhabdus haliotis]
MSLSDSLQKLNEFDINDLDVENIGSWPVAVKAIIGVILLSGLLYAGYAFHVQDMLVQLERVEAEEKTLKEQFGRKAFQAANLQAYRDQMVEMERSFGALVKQLPSETEVAGLLEDITQAGMGSGLTFNSIQLQKEQTKGFYIELPIQISVQGNYHDLGSFVSAVAALPRIVTLHNFTIKPVGRGNNEILQMSITAKTYRYNDKSGGGKKKSNKRKK